MRKEFHTQNIDQALSHLETQQNGLSLDEVKQRIIKYGLNVLAVEKAPSWVLIFLRQFKSPLIYILLCALVISILIKEHSDAIFIAAVLIFNALIGTIQEHGAETTAQSLRKIMPNLARVLRGGKSYEIKSEHVVPGDIVLLEAGLKVPADCRLIESNSLEVNESLLTGESLPVNKTASKIFSAVTPIPERSNMIYSGTLITRGRGRGVVVATGQDSELGQIATIKQQTKPPLLLRMESFTRRIAYAMAVVVIFMLFMAYFRDIPLLNMFYLAVALAVAAIPEGLPIALTIALAIGTKRMGKRNVIVRKLVAVEALGSCTYIGSDKTGTLTVNELTATRIVTPSGNIYKISGEGIEPIGEISVVGNKHTESSLLAKIAHTCILNNEGILDKRNGNWTAHGDSVDVALLVLAHKLGFKQFDLKQNFSVTSDIPYESEKAYSATAVHDGAKTIIHLKGSPERLLSMCSKMYLGDELTNIDQEHIKQQLHNLALDGYRVLAICQGDLNTDYAITNLENHLQDLRFLGLIGIIDPLRKEVPQAIQQCQQAGLKVTIITGDHPITAYAIAKNLNLVDRPDQVVSGSQLQQVYEKDRKEFENCIRNTAVFARVSPQQKKQIIDTANKQGQFVAVTGDGINDVPAMRAAHIGVSMGKRGTDVARESSSIIVTDDNFASIVSGIEEGRIAYANVRKVIYFLLSTGVAEVLLFIFALFANLPMPLLPVQLLWLNIVTQGCQDVAFAFEEAEGDELVQPPRSPKEPIFNGLMLRRVLLASFTMASIAFAVFYLLLEWHFSLADAQNLTLLLMVLFINIQAFNCRSETQTLFKRGILGNKFLLIGVLVAQLVHIGAMYMPGLSAVLNMQPVSIFQWMVLLIIATSIFFVVEAQKLLYIKTK